MRSYKKWLLILLPCILAGGIIGAIWLKASAEDAPRLVVQLGHSAEVRAVAFSHDGKLVLTGSADRTAVLWDVVTGREIRRFVGHKAGINAVAFSPDNHFVMTGSGQIEVETDFVIEPESSDASARIWDVNTGKEVLRVEEKFGSITSVAFSPDGKHILTGTVIWNDPNAEGFRGKACLWSMETGKQVQQLKIDSALSGINSSVAFSADGYSALIGFEGNPVQQLWDITTGRIIRQYNGSGKAAFSSDGQRILVSNGNVLDVKTGESIDRLTANLYDCIFSPDDQFVIGKSSPSHSGFQVKAVNLSTGRLVSVIYDSSKHKQTTSGDPIIPTAFSPNGRFVLIGRENGDSHIYNLATGKDEVVFRGRAEIAMANFLPNGRLIAAGNNLWEITSGKQLNPFPDKVQVTFSPNGREVLLSKTRLITKVIEALGNKVRIEETQSDGTLIDLQTGQKRQLIEYGALHFAGPTFSPNGQLILIGDMAHTINLWDVSTGTRLRRIRLFGADGETNAGPDYSHYAAIFSPDGRYIFMEIVEETSSQTNYFPALVSVESGEIAMKFEMKNSEEYIDIASAAFSPDGRYVLSGSNGGYYNGKFVKSIAILWDVATGKEVRRLEEHSEEVTAVAFSPDGRFILTGGGDRFVILWDAATGEVIRRLESSFSNGLSVSFSPDSRFALTGSHDGALAIWNVATGQELCRLISFENGDWVATTVDGRFDTNNLENISGLHWITTDEPLKPLPLEIFMRQYYEPRLLARVMAGDQFKPLPKLSELNRTQPEVKITDIKQDSAETIEVSVVVANAKSAGQKSFFGKPLESGVYDVRLFRNGQLVGYAPENDGEVKLNAEGKATLKFSKVQLPRTGVEQVEFSAYAFNADRIKSATDRKTYALTPKPAPIKGRAYLIRLGVDAYERESLNLRYAANDARRVDDLAARLAARGEYAEVVSVPLISDYAVTLADGRSVAAQDATLQQVREGRKRVTENSATKAHLRAVLDVLAGRQADAALLKQIPNADKLRAARPEDLVLISASSHGYTDSDGIFYLVPSDTGTAPLASPEFRSRCVSSDELSRWLRDVDAGELVMIVDACHSAAAVEGTDFKPGPMGSRGLGQLSYDKGMRILTATQADNVALEANKVRQGLLIYALLEDGLASWLADYKPRDKSILLTEWLGYGVERVPRLYEEMKDGRIRGTFDPRELENDKTQQPSLFDFARWRREVVLARLP